METGQQDKADSGAGGGRSSDEKSGGGGGWGWLGVEKLSRVAPAAGPWRTESRSSQQDCVEQIDFDTGAQPGDEPQKGQ